MRRHEQLIAWILSSCTAPPLQGRLSELHGTYHAPSNGSVLAGSCMRWGPKVIQVAKAPIPPPFGLWCCPQAHACSPTVFALPAVQAVINFKWTGWARTFLLYELFCYCLWLASFTAFTLIFQGEDWTTTFWESVQDRCARSSFCVVVHGHMRLVVHCHLCHAWC